MAKAPKPGTTPSAVAEADESSVLRVVLDDEVVEIDAREFSAEEDNALRRASGFSLEYHFAQFDDGGDPSLSIILGIVWIVKRRTKSQLKYKSFLAGAKYDSVRVEFPDLDDEADDLDDEPVELSGGDPDFPPSAAV